MASASLAQITRAQREWAATLPSAARRQGYPDYLSSYKLNLFLGDLSTHSRQGYESADGGELRDGKRPAKMSSLLSSSALVVNFFDAWIGSPLDRLQAALGLPAPIATIEFEHRCERYPVGPRRPNLDLVITLDDGSIVGVEGKFVEPYRDATKRRALAEKYLGKDRLWAGRGMPEAETFARGLSGRRGALDSPQLLKHILGLRSEYPGKPTHLLYIWYDTGASDAAEHAIEVEAFVQAVNGTNVTVKAMSYQTLFKSLAGPAPQGHPQWSHWIENRYFGRHPHSA